MFRKEEKKAMTRLALLSIGWPAGLDRFYDGKVKDGILSLVGWGIVFVSIMLLSPCHGYQYVDGAKVMPEMSSTNPLIILPLAFGVYGGILVLRKGFRLLRQFETAAD